KNMGEYYMKEEMYDKAEVQFQKALYILNQCEHERLIGSTHIYKSLGILYEETQRFLPAIEAYHKSLLFSTVGYSEQDVYNYPFVDLKSMNFEIKYEVDSWLELFLSKAHTFFKYYCFQTQNLKDLKAAFRGYEVAFRFLNQVRQSFQSNQSKLRIIKAINQKLFQVIPATYLLFEVSQEKRYLNDAFKFAEKNKAYLILNDKQEKNAKQAADLPTALLEQEKKLQMNLTSLQKNIQAQKQKGEQGNTEKLQKLQTDYFNAYNEFEELRKQFESNYPDYYLQKYSVETVSIPNLQSTLQENQTVLSYFIGEEQIYLFVITSDEYEVFALDKPDNWTDLIQKYLQSIKIHQKAQFQQLSFDLYQILLQEAMHHVIAPFKEEPKQVFIIPHAELHYLPFETLIISEASTSMPYKDMDYLLNYCQISYHYSATLLHLDLQKQEMKEEQAPAEITFTGFAPVYTSSSNAQKQALETLQTEYATAVSRSEAVRSDGTWMPLLHSKIEVENIAQLFEEKGLQSQAFLYETANKSNLEEQIGNSRFVLIAAHGIVNDEYPELSGLVLAENTMDDRRRTTNVVENSPSFEKHGDIWNGEEERNVEEMTVEDCILNMKEVAMIPMKADLVVLSSCESGIGELHKGEGMMAINRGFLASGAKNVVSTLFKVNDRASSELTQLLFANILKGESYSIALQKAKLELLKKKKDVSPKMWSGFVLFGKGK
ncbi:MAG: CHAT domain-containing protein, partial [Chitinophagales bacterium]